MKKSIQLGFIPAFLAVSVALTGCNASTSGNSNTESKTDGVSADTATAGHQILIATQSPLSGPQSAIGDSLKSGAEYALILQQEEFKKLGFDLKLLPQDDQADPKIGVSNAEMLISNPDVLGVVGHLNTGVSIPASVKYEEAGLVMVSPSNTGVKLTEEGKKTVHRICARDDAQGPKAAIYAKNQLGAKAPFIIHDKTAFGQGLADEVKKQFEKDGIQVIGFEGITPGEKDYSAVLNQLVAKNPDTIYFGGVYTEAGIFIKQAREKGYKGSFIGPDNFGSTDMVKIAGEATDGVVFTTIVGDITDTEVGKKWSAEYEKTMGKKVESYSSLGYESMNIILNAVKGAIKENGGKKPTREEILNLVHSTKEYKGMFTSVSFDDKGDNTLADVYIYKYEKDKPVFLGKAE